MSKQKKHPMEFDNMTEILNAISDEADHIIGTEADNHKEVAIQDAKRIQELARQGRFLAIQIKDDLQKSCLMLP